MKKIFSALVLIGFGFVAAAATKPMTFKWKDSNGNSYEQTVDIPEDLISIVKENQHQIEKALEGSDFTDTDFQDIANQVKTEYDNTVSGNKDIPDITGSISNLNDFSDNLSMTIPNAQLSSTVWAQSWIGYIFPGIHFGAGVNTSASTLDLKPLKKMGDCLNMGSSMSDIPETLAFPIATVDFRFGGLNIGTLKLPFDIGFNITSLDTSSLGLDSSLNGISIDYFNIGFDARYALLEGGFLIPRISVGAGYSYTSGGFNYDGDEAEAAMDFKSSTFYLSAQVSERLLFFIPFAGLKLGFSQSTVDWKVSLNWEELLDFTSTDIIGSNDYLLTQALKTGLLPNKVDGGADNFVFVPQIYGGFGLDLFVLDLTFSGAIDLANQNFALAFSTRISW